MAGIGQMTATGARAAQLRQVGQGLLDEGFMEVIAGDVDNIGTSITEASSAVAELKGRTTVLESAMQGMTNEVVDMAGKLDRNDQGLKDNIDKTFREVTQNIATLQ